MSVKDSSILSAALLALFLLCCGASPVSAAAGSIVVSVVDDSGPVGSGEAQGALFLEESNEYLRETSSDSDGRLSFDGLSAGTYSVRVQYLAVRPPSVKFEFHIVVGPGQRVQRSVSFRSGAQLRLQVRSTNGSVPRGRIDAYLFDQQTTRIVANVRADGLGEADFGDVAPGVYYATVRHWSMSETEALQTFDIIVRPQAPQMRRVEIRLCPSLVFDVSDSFSQAPEGSATVFLSHQESPPEEVVATKSCDAAGRVEFGEVVAGLYRARVVYNRGGASLERFFFGIEAKQDEATVVPIVLDEVARLCCEVSDAQGEPVSGSGVQLSLIFDRDFSVVAEGEPDGNGVVDFGYVATGSYTIKVENLLVQPAEERFILGQHAEAGQTTTVGVTVQRGCQLDLSVVYDGQAVASGTATAYLHDQQTGEPVRSALAGEGGICRYENLPPGTYIAQIYYQTDPPIERFFFDVAAHDGQQDSYVLELLDYSPNEGSSTYQAVLTEVNGPANGHVYIYDQPTGKLVASTSRYGLGSDGQQEWELPPGVYTVQYVYEGCLPNFCKLIRDVDLSQNGSRHTDYVSVGNGTMWFDLRDKSGSAQGRMWLYDSSGALLTEEDGYPLLADNDHTFNLLPGTFSVRYLYTDTNGISVYLLDLGLALSAGQRRSVQKTVQQGTLSILSFDSIGPVYTAVRLYNYVAASNGYRRLSSPTLLDDAETIKAAPSGERVFDVYTGDYQAEVRFTGYSGPTFVKMLDSDASVGPGQSQTREVCFDTCYIMSSISDCHGPHNGHVCVFDETTGRSIGETPASGVGDDGQYTLVVPPGQFRLELSYSSDAMQATTQHQVRLGAGETESVGESFLSNQVELTVLKDGAALSQARAYLYGADGLYFGRKYDSGIGASGTVSFFPAPGTYFMMVEDFSGDETTTFFFPEFVVSECELVTLNIDTSTGQYSVRKSGGSTDVSIVKAVCYPSLFDLSESKASGGQNELLLCAWVVHSQGPEHITSVLANLTPIGGPSDAALYDDGTHGDVRAADFVFSLYTSASFAQPGVAEIALTARDDKGFFSNGTITMIVRGAGSDTEPPGAINDLSAERGQDATRCVLRWTASGDDGYSGRASHYELRYSTEPFDASTFGEATLYDASTSWVPAESGEPEQKTVTGLNAGSAYYFALKVYDDADNASAMSNLASTAAPQDTIPPARIDDLAASSGPSEGQVTLVWTATGDDGRQGRASGYLLKYSQSVITEASWASATTLAESLEWDPLPSGASETQVLSGFDPGTTYYFAIKAIDDAGNWSPVSNNASAGGGADRIPPGTIEDLSAQEGELEGEVVLSWTATGDDGELGVATRYILRYSTSLITEANWRFATTYEPSLSWAPKPAGQQELKVVSGLDPGRTLYFALKVFDEAQNSSGVSNCASAVSGRDTVPPSPITDLAAEPGDYSATLVWTATGDDGIEGQAAAYELRYSERMISSGNWDDATLYEASTTWLPKPAGAAESHQVLGLAAGKRYYFALKAIDESGNSSPISNVASAVPLGDSQAPAAISDLSGRKWLNAGEILLRWTATGDNGRFGRAAGYELRFSDYPIDENNWALAPVYMPSHSWTPQKSGRTEEFVISGFPPQRYLYFAVKAVDEAGNWSGVSNCFGTMPSDGSPTAAILCNATSFSPHDRLVAEFSCFNPGDAVDVDLYAVVLLPDGGFLSLPHLTCGLETIQWRPLPGSFLFWPPYVFLDLTVDESIPAGEYVFLAAFCSPGTLSPVTDVWVCPVTICGE